MRVQDVPGTGPALLGGLRQVDALLAVADGFSGNGDPDSDLEQLELELLVADTDHVAKRLERVEKQAKSGDAGVRKEAEILRAILAHLESGQPLTEWTGELPDELDPLTTKPLIAIVNGPGWDRLQARGRAGGALGRGGSGLPRRCLGTRRGRAAAQGRPRPDHVLHRR